MMKSVVIIKHPSIRKAEAEEVKKSIEKADNNFIVVLVDDSIQVEVLPPLY